MSSEEFKLMTLRGAVCEYLDEEQYVEDFFRDLRIILEEEEDAMAQKATMYKNVRKKLFSK